jgi:hypothetical protein
MNPSGPESYEDLANAMIEGDLTPEAAARLEQWLREDPNRPEMLRAELDFADRFEQALIPNRSVPAFLNGLETRFHAEATADEFLQDLLPRLREIDAREAKTKIVPFPAQRAWIIGLSSAAAVAIAFFLVGRPASGPEAPGVAKLAQTSSDIVWSKPDGKPGSIEWQVGSSIPAGTSIRLDSGTVRFDLANGSVITVEGPADFEMKSASEARLVRGNVVATVAPNDAPFTISAPGMAFQVEGSTTAVRTLEGDKLEAAVLSTSGSATAVSQSSGGTKDEIGPKEALVTHSPDGLKELLPVDPEAYRGHINLLAGITSHSDDVAVDLPQGTGLPSTEAPIVVALERENLEPKAAVRVDLTPAKPLPLAHARNLSIQNRPEVETGKRLRSYVVDVGNLRSAPAPGGYVEAFIEFDKPILGIAATPDTLTPSNSVVGNDLPHGTIAGLTDADTVTISEDGRTLKLRLKEADRDVLASFRVFVQEREIALPSLSEGAFATPRVNDDPKPDLTGKNLPDAPRQP